ncbi:SCP domain-containing protein [Citrus sinensis]|nr:SCP domain-containing protein [Citrus sinensis]
MPRTSPAIFCLLALATIHLSSAHNKPEDYLKAHNEARASVGGNCNLKKPQVSKYSETIAWSSQGEITAAEFVKMYMDGKPLILYDYNSNICALNGTKCAIYTQVVWRNSVRLGCAKERCNNNGILNFVICNYDPRGNVFGQRPY